MRPLLRGSLLALAVVLVAACVWLWLRQDPRSPAPAASSGGSPLAAATEPVPASPPPSEAPPSLDPDELSGAWANVDLDEVRAALPDNVYWESALPTDDPRILEARAAESARWNDEFGKVQSGTATEAEIEAYFDHRHRYSSDYVEFTKYLLRHYGSELPPQDVALLELAQRMHLARLVEMPRKLEEAYARKRQQDEARQAWLESEAEFAGD
jgi:hypothetical protein